MNLAKTQRVICVVSPYRNAYSETFVRAHRELLPAQIENLYGLDYDTLSDDAGLLVKPELAARLTRVALRRLLSLNGHYFQQQALRRFLRGNKVEAVLAEFGPTATLLMDVCRELQIPLIAHFHGYDAYQRTTLENYADRYEQLFESAAAIIAVSRDMQAQLLKLGAPADKTHYNSCGVETEKFKGATPLDSAPTFVAVGRFVNKKAPHLTLLAFRMMLEKVPDARLVMIGDGPLWETCYQMRASLRLSDAVELTGPRSHSEVAAAMQQARAFVQHSVTTHDGDSEGTPVAVLEAGASGLPVVATRHAGIKDAVVDEKTGLLINEGDLPGMAEQMIRLARDPHLAAQLGQAGRHLISAEYSMEKSIQGLWTIIEDSISKR